MLLQPLDRFQAPSTVDKEFLLSIGFVQDENGVRHGSFNATPFKLPKDKPLLMKMLQGEELGPETLPLHIDHMDVVQVIVNNPFDGAHPVHIHGHVFWVLGAGEVGDGDFDANVHKLRTDGVKRDTVQVKPRSWLVIRFIADNPGLWTLHCHIDWHNLSGMAATIVEAADVARRNFKIPVAAKSICADHGIII